MNSYKYEYEWWLKKSDDELISELQQMDEDAIEDAFYRDLALVQVDFVESLVLELIV